MAGAAQRKTKRGFLHQGTIALMMPAEEILQEVLLHPQDLTVAMQQHTFPLLHQTSSMLSLRDARSALKQALAKAFKTVFYV